MCVVSLLSRVRETTRLSDKMTRAHKKLADSFIGVGSYLSLLPQTKNDPIAVYGTPPLSFSCSHAFLSSCSISFLFIISSCVLPLLFPQREKEE